MHGAQSSGIHFTQDCGKSRVRVQGAVGRWLLDVRVERSRERHPSHCGRISSLTCSTSRTAHMSELLTRTTGASYLRRGKIMAQFTRRVEMSFSLSRHLPLLVHCCAVVVVGAAPDGPFSSALNTILNVPCVWSRCCGRIANQHDLAGAVLHRDGRGLLRDHLLAEQPAALQDVSLDVGRQDLHVLAALWPTSPRRPGRRP